MSIEAKVPNGRPSQQLLSSCIVSVQKQLEDCFVTNKYILYVNSGSN